MSDDRSGAGRFWYRLYLGMVFAAAIPILLWGISETEPTLTLALVLSATVVEFLPARVRPGLVATLITFVVLTGQLLDGTSAAVVASFGVVAAGLYKTPDRRLLKSAFNVSQHGIAAFVAGVFFETVAARADGLSGITAPRTLATFAVASLLLAIVNIILVSGVISLDSGESFGGALRSGLQPALLQVPYAALSVLAAILILDVGVQALLLMVVPAVVARTGLLAFQRVDEAYERLVRSFAKTIEAKDEYTKGHSERVSYLSDLVAGDLRIGYEERRLVRYAAMLHDVGKIGVPLCVINKPGPLDDQEFHQMKAHPIIGENILRDIDFLLPVLDVVRHHHERLDGRGYPDGLTAEDLSEAVRIVTAVDAFDAMTSTRAYRRSMSVTEAMVEMNRCSGSQFDRRIVTALEAVVARIGWEPTMAWGGDMTEIPDVTHVPPLTDRHDLRIGDQGLTTERGS